MKIVNAVLCFIAIGLLACTSKPVKISDRWFGSYDIYITYGDTTHGYSDNPAENAQSIGYGVTIHQDSSTFEGVGFQTDFTYLCEVRENGNELHLLYLKLIDGFQYREPSPLDTLATLIKDGAQYYIKSPKICDDDGVCNKKMPLTKKK